MKAKSRDRGWETPYRLHPVKEFTISDHVASMYIMHSDFELSGHDATELDLYR